MIALKKLDRYVLGAMLYIIGWSVAFFVAWLVKNQEAAVLEGCILAPGAVELVCAAWIKQGKGKDSQDAVNPDDELPSNAIGFEMPEENKNE